MPDIIFSNQPDNSNEQLGYWPNQELSQYEIYRNSNNPDDVRSFRKEGNQLLQVELFTPTVNILGSWKNKPDILKSLFSQINVPSDVHIEPINIELFTKDYLTNQRDDGTLSESQRRLNEAYLPHLWNLANDPRRYWDYLPAALIASAAIGPSMATNASANALFRAISGGNKYRTLLGTYNTARGAALGAAGEASSITAIAQALSNLDSKGLAQEAIMFAPLAFYNTGKGAYTTLRTLSQLGTHSDDINFVKDFFRQINEIKKIEDLSTKNAAFRRLASDLYKYNSPNILSNLVKALALNEGTTLRWSPRIPNRDKLEFLFKTKSPKPGSNSFYHFYKDPTNGRIVILRTSNHTLGPLNKNKWIGKSGYAYLDEVTPSSKFVARSNHGAVAAAAFKNLTEEDQATLIANAPTKEIRDYFKHLLYDFTFNYYEPGKSLLPRQRIPSKNAELISKGK